MPEHQCKYTFNYKYTFASAASAISKNSLNVLERNERELRVGGGWVGGGGGG